MVAFNVVMPDVPPMFSVAPTACVSAPVPLKAVPTVRLLLLVRVTAPPVTVTLGIVRFPVKACEFVSNVCTPVPALKVPLFVMPPRNVTAEFAAVFVHVAPDAIVTRPVKVRVLLAVIVRAPLVPPPTVVVPVTANVEFPIENVAPLLMLRFPVTVVLPLVDAVPDTEITRFR